MHGRELVAGRSSPVFSRARRLLDVVKGVRFDRAVASGALTLLHLSDLHFGPAQGRGHFWNSESTELKLPSHDRRGLLGSLVRDLRLQSIKPDLAIISGDLLDKASKPGVCMAVSFLRGLAEELHLDPRRIVIVPGNHDLCSIRNSARSYAHFDQIWSDFYGDARPALGPDSPPHKRVLYLDYGEELGAELVGFNSCEALDLATGQHHGSIGTAQRDLAEELLAPTQVQGRFRIAVMHHHLARPVGVVRKDYSVRGSGVGRRRRAVDATTVEEPGATGTDWRVCVPEALWLPVSARIGGNDVCRMDTPSP
jgi:3',5'-cyclic AMP phosphodiesterase CpdA